MLSLVVIRFVVLCYVAQDQHAAESQSQSAGNEDVARRRPHGQYSTGRMHGAFCRAGHVAKQVQEACQLQRFANSVEQDVCRITFSTFARGSHSAAFAAAHSVSS